MYGAMYGALHPLNAAFDIILFKYSLRTTYNMIQLFEGMVRVWLNLYHMV